MVRTRFGVRQTRGEQVKKPAHANEGPEGGGAGVRAELRIGEGDWDGLGEPFLNGMVSATVW